MIALRSPRVRAVLVSIAVVFAPLLIARALHGWVEFDEATLLAVPIAIVLGAWLGWRVVRPLEKLEAQVAKKADARADLSLERDDEYARLTEAMNALLARLEARQRAHEAFVADLVHALKSPVAAARVVAERLLEGELDRTRAARLGAALDASAARLEGIARSLLELARAEGGLPGEERRAIDPVALATEIIASARADGRWREVTISLEASGDPRIFGVEARLRAALECLLDNARSFGRHVTVGVHGGPERLRLIIDNDGPPIPADDRERVFERFYTTRNAEGGTGLGLAFARAVAEAHGGRCFVEDRARFVIELPRALDSRAGPP